MNGIALLLITATLGVEYDWRTTDDGQIEYILIVEQDFIPSLAQGDEIRSSVPPELESLQRLCIRISQSPKKGIAPPPTQERRLPADAFRNTRIGLRAAEPVTILWRANGQPEETTSVRYGWQPTKEGQQEYFVQIDPKFLRTLMPGDEIYATLAPEAGRTDTFVVFSNAKQLPKVAGKPAAAPLAKTNPTPPSFAAGFGQPPATAPPAAPNAFNAPPLAPAPNSTAFGPPTTGFNSNPGTGFNDKPYTPPRTFGVTDDPLNDPNASRVNPATNYGPAAPAATDNVRGYNWETNRNEPARPGLNPPPVNSTGFNSPGASNNSLNPPLNPPYRNDTYGANGQRDNGMPNSNFPANPPNNSYTSNDQYPSGNFANNQNGNLRPGTQLPAAGNAPYRPSVGYPQDNHVANNGYNNNPSAPPNPQVGNYQPTLADNQFASVPTSNTLRPGVREELKPGVAGTLGTQTAPDEKPWWPLVFVTFFALISFGANLYLGWTAAEFYSRYRLAVERLRTAGPRG